MLLTHLLKRRCNVSLHQPVLDSEEQVATFYLWNLSGQLVGYQQYRPTAPKHHTEPKLARYFTYHQNGLVVFGLESLCLPGPVFVVEGVFDACRFTQAGRPALAVLSNNPKPQVREWLRCLGRPTVFVTDGDSAGHQLARRERLSMCCPAGHDPADAPDDWFASLLSRFPAK